MGTPMRCEAGFAPRNTYVTLGQYRHESMNFLKSMISHIVIGSLIARRRKMSRTVAKNKTNVADKMHRRSDCKTQRFREYASTAIPCHDFNFAKCLISYRSCLSQNFARRSLIHLRSNKPAPTSCQIFYLYGRQCHQSNDNRKINVLLAYSACLDQSNL